MNLLDLWSIFEKYIMSELENRLKSLESVIKSLETKCAVLSSLVETKCVTDYFKELRRPDFTEMKEDLDFKCTIDEKHNPPENTETFACIMKLNSSLIFIDYW